MSWMRSNERSIAMRPGTPTGSGVEEALSLPEGIGIAGRGTIFIPQMGHFAFGSFDVCSGCIGQ